MGRFETEQVRIGHCINAYLYNDDVKFIDAQRGLEYSKDEAINIFSRVENIRYLRTNDLRLTDLGATACEKVIK